MITLPPSPDDRTALTISEAAERFGRGPDWFRVKFLDTGIIEKNPFGMIWASECTEEYVRRRMEEMGLNYKLTTAAKFQIVKKGRL